MKNKLLISMDVEESDIPEEFGRKVFPEKKLSVSHAGLLSALELFEHHQVRATFFISAYWAQHYPQLVRKLAEKHEVASHLCCYSKTEVPYMESSRLILEEICQKPVYGCKMQGLLPKDHVQLKKAGYMYNASLHKQRTPFLEEGIWIIPSSVSPLFKNMPAFVFRYYSSALLRKDKLLSFSPDPEQLDKLDGYLAFLKKNGEFTTHKDWLLGFKEF